MILLHVIAESKKDAEFLVRFLIKEKFLFSAHIHPITEYESSSGMPQPKWELTGRTKALLFQNIKQALQSNDIGKHLPIYATPIVYLDEDQSEIIRNHTLKT
jgi:hypothetical protein